MKKIALALMLTISVNDAQAQEMRPLGELLETAAASYPSTRCSGLYQAIMDWTGKKRAGDEPWITMDAARKSLFLNSVLIFNQETDNTIETSVEVIAQEASSIADLYLARMKSNYAAQGEAFSQDELIIMDMITCQTFAQMALDILGALDQSER